MWLPKGRQSPEAGAGREGGEGPGSSDLPQNANTLPWFDHREIGGNNCAPQASPGQLLPHLCLSRLSSSSSTLQAMVFLWMAEEEKTDFLQNWVQNLIKAEFMSYFPPPSPAGIHLPSNSSGRLAISTCWCHAPSSLCGCQWITLAMINSVHTPALPLWVSRPLTHPAIHYSSHHLYDLLTAGTDTCPPH